MEKEIRFFGNSKNGLNFIMNNHKLKRIPFSVTYTTSYDILENNTVIYKFMNYKHENKDADFKKNIFIFDRVKKSIDDYYDKFGHDFEYSKDNISKLFNLKNCEKFENQMLFCFDINSCYWTIAYNLGFIDEKLYKRGIFHKNKSLEDALFLNFISKTKYKKAKLLDLNYEQAYLNGLIPKGKYNKSVSNTKNVLLFSLGFLIKHIHTEYYNETGEVYKKDNHNEYKDKYNPFFYKILNYLGEFISEISKLSGFCMAIVDCVYFGTDNEKEYRQIAEKYGFMYKQFTSCITNIGHNSITWFDDSKNKYKTENFEKYDLIS